MGRMFNAGLSRKSAMGWTALHYAVINGDVELVKYLIKYGANVNKATGKVRHHFISPNLEVTMFW